MLAEDFFFYTGEITYDALVFLVTIITKSDVM